MKDSKKIIKKPDGFIYFIAYHLVKPFLRHLMIRVVLKV